MTVLSPWLDPQRSPYVNPHGLAMLTPPAPEPARHCQAHEAWLCMCAAFFCSSAGFLFLQAKRHERPITFPLEHKERRRTPKKEQEKGYCLFLFWFSALTISRLSSLICGRIIQTESAVADQIRNPEAHPSPRLSSPWEAPRHSSSSPTRRRRPGEQARSLNTPRVGEEGEDKKAKEASGNSFKGSLRAGG